MNSPSFSPCYRPAGRSTRRVTAAFTLVELLVVMLVILTLLGLTAPLIRGVVGGRNIGDSLDAIADYLSYARTQAMTQNTYTVVGFYQASGTDDLQIGGVISTKGTFDASQFASSPPTYSTTYPALGKIAHVSNVTFVTEPNLSSDLKSRLDNAGVTAGITNGSVVDCLSTSPNNASVFSFLSNKTAFGRNATNNQKGSAFPACVIVFSPQGEALYFPQAAFSGYPNSPITVSSTMPFYGQLFLGLRATRNGNVVTNDQNSAALTLDGGSGSIKTYRL